MRTQYHSKFLTVPPEIRNLIYSFIFAEAEIILFPRTREQYIEGNGNLWTLQLPPSRHVLLACKQCYAEARAIFLGSSKLVYMNSFSVRDITTICSRSTAAHIRRLYGIQGLCFEDFELMNDYFPHLKLLCVETRMISRPTLHETELRALQRDWFMTHLPQSGKQGDMLRFFIDRARFRTVLCVRVIMLDFRDEPRGLEVAKLMILDMKSGKVDEYKDPRYPFWRMPHLIQESAG